MVTLDCPAATNLEPRDSVGTIVRLQDIVAAYDQAPVLNGLSLDVKRGELLVVLGPSGCGKSTLLKLIAAIIAPHSGKVDRHFRRIALIYQEPRLLPWRTAFGNVVIGLLQLGLEQNQQNERVGTLLGRCGLDPVDWHRYPAELSGGMSQRVAIARALAAEPDLLLMDEPFIALDVGRRRAMQNLVRDLVVESGTTLVLVTHDLAEAVRVGNRLLIMTPTGTAQPPIPISMSFSERTPEFVQQTVAALSSRPELREILSITETGE